MQGDKTDLKPEMKPIIRLKGDMIGIHIPGLNRTKLIDGPTAFELGLKLVQDGKRLVLAYEAACRDAEDHLDVDASEDVPKEQRKEEYKAFVFEAMIKRLGIDSEDDLDLDEDYMEDPDIEKT